MSCLDNASAVWFNSVMVQPNLDSPAAGFAETYMDSLPKIYLGMGMSCSEVKSLITQAFQPGVAAIKSGTVIPAFERSMAVTAGDFGVRCIVDGDEIGQAIYFDGTFDSNIPSLVMGVDVRQSVQYWSMVGQLNIRIPATVLQSFDFDKWWCCASGCCAASLPPPRKGMQVFSNYTYAVKNSFGQVPRQ